MGEYTEECINTFLMNQGQLFDEPVAENYDEAEAFLEDCFAVVADNLDDVRAYMEEEGMDVEEMSDAELEVAFAKAAALFFRIRRGDFLRSQQ